MMEWGEEERLLDGAGVWEGRLLDGVRGGKVTGLSKGRKGYRMERGVRHTFRPV